jgi:hypothetical protein
MNNCPICNAGLDISSGHFHQYDQYLVQYFCEGGDLPNQTDIFDNNDKLIFSEPKIIPIENIERIEMLLLLK